MDASGQSVIHALLVAHGGELELKQVMVLLYKGEERIRRPHRCRERRCRDRPVEARGRGSRSPEKTVRTVPVYTFKTDLTVERIQDSFSSPSTVSFWELPRFIRSLEATGFSALSHRLHWHSLLAEPLLYCSMIPIAAIPRSAIRACGACFTPSREASRPASSVLPLRSRAGAAHSTRLPPMLAAWAPALASSMIGLAVLIHVEDG